MTRTDIKKAGMDKLMNYFKKIKTEGISLRFVYKGLLVLAVIVSAFLLYATYHSSATYKKLSHATDDYIELQKAAYELMDASDYLTENVQRFTVAGNMKFLNAYFTEAFETQRREEAIEIMARNENSTEALAMLQKAMDESISLMDREYYAMKLVIEAKGYEDYPEILRSVELSPADKALSSTEKMDLAQTMVLDDVYYDQKDLIRHDMRESLERLENKTHSAQIKTDAELESELQLVRILIILQTAGIMVMIWLTSKLGINPVLKAVENIREDSPIPVMGAIEFRYLARTYNKMYEVYKKSIAHLNYKASHDELTQAYNRSGYELIVSTIDLRSTYLLLFDADNFKTINDTYGHDTGDKMLKRIIEVLRRNFRSDDYICRIGGDEIVVLMVHMEQEQRKLLEFKVVQINEELAEAENGIPPISVSVGVVHGKNAENADELLKKADQMLYETKKRGKKGVTFYEG